MSPSKPAGGRSGQTLLELVAATTIIALAVVPALRLLSDALPQGRRIESQHLLTALVSSKLDQVLAQTATDWQTGSLGGDFSAEGWPGHRWQVTRSDSAADGGIANRLMVVSAVVWEDLDGNAVRGGGEPATTLATKVAKLAKYQNEAAGS